MPTSSRPGRAGVRPALRAALIMTGVYAALAVVLLAGHDLNPQWFVRFGPTSGEVELARRVFGPDLAVPYDESQDGTRFWVLARDPLLTDRDTIVAALDRPAYRSQRVLYPLLAAPGRLAGEQGVMWALLLVNVGAIFGGTLCAGLLAAELRAPPRAAYAFGCNPAVIVAFMHDLSDGLAIAGVVAMVLAVRRNRWGWAAFAVTAAALAKEPALLAAVGVALVVRAPVRRRLALVAVPCAVVAGWALVVRWRLPATPLTVTEFVPLPFRSFFESYRSGWSVYRNYPDLLAALAVVALAVLVVARFVRHRSLELAAALPFALIVPFLAEAVVFRAVNSVRSLGPAVTLLVLDVYAGWASRERQAVAAPAG